MVLSRELRVTRLGNWESTQLQSLLSSSFLDPTLRALGFRVWGRGFRAQAVYPRRKLLSILGGLYRFAFVAVWALDSFLGLGCRA